MVNNFNKEQYYDFLESSLGATFKILPLFEQENEFLEEYINSLIDYHFKGAQEFIGDYSNSVWLVNLVNTLAGLKNSLNGSTELEHRIVKREVFKMVRIIKKQMERCDHE